MVRRYCAFMVRCWVLSEGTQRVEIECISSGEKIAVASLAAALDWMAVRVFAAVPRAAMGTQDEDEREQGAREPPL